MSTRGWIGVGLDGTLAEKSSNPEEIGAPIPAMVEQVKKWLAKREDVRVISDRVYDDNPAVKTKRRKMINAWCRQHVGVGLYSTCEIEPGMKAFYDYRAIKPVSGGAPTLKLVEEPAPEPDADDTNPDMLAAHEVGDE